MADPRKPIYRPEAAQQDEMRRRAHDHLMQITETACRDMGIGGASFVVMGIAIWGAELCELDQRAASRMFAAIATLYDPTVTEKQKERAEILRRKAVKRLFAAVDLDMATPAGNA